MKIADYVFETSWEICNKVGGIYTVLSTKAFTAVNHYKDNYICLGPDLSKEQNNDFIEDSSLFKNWRDFAGNEGLKFRIGRWNIAGSPIVILVDFTPFFEKKNEILTHFWLRYKLDSIAGQWDYVEPALFGYAAGRVIESFYQFYCSANDKIIAHFHEWMTGTGILHLEDTVPQIATVFTTHATVLGRCLAGNNFPLYSNMNSYNPQECANRFGVQSKFSLEYLSAVTADAFTTVSQITNTECEAFFGKKVDAITINGFENSFVPQDADYEKKRKIARHKLIAVAQALTQQKIDDNALLIINSGRYEFKNKGIDIFIDALGRLNSENIGRELVAFVAVPAGTTGCRADLLNRMEVDEKSMPVLGDYATHRLHDYSNDPIIRKIKECQLLNAPENDVKVIFVPVYLNGFDGIFDMPYYDLLAGFDLSVFPSYYEPWGYTPLESAAFGIPTITTSLAGFGMWVKENFSNQKGVHVVLRNDTNGDETSAEIAQTIRYYAQTPNEQYVTFRNEARQVANQALWENLYKNYLEAYSIALNKSALRFDRYKTKVSKIGLLTNPISKNQPNWIQIMVKSKLPDSLKRLEELAHNLWWSWNYEARELFIEIAGEDLWKECDENPTRMLQILPLPIISEKAENKDFISKLNRVYEDFRTYMETPRTRPESQVAYFSMEFGISNELKIFSGGLGMLAGDYLKEASDSNVNMVGVGLLYRQGYFTQQISASGEQLNMYPVQSFSKLPITPIKDENGDWKLISIALPGRMLYARIWRVNVGRIPLYLLDTNFDKNREEDRQITYRLYGGDVENRLKQELLLGIGGMRMLKLLGIEPALFHLNEGHSAFMTLERVLDTMSQKQLPLPAAIEWVRATSLYTTHTPVPAGHDAFSEDLLRTYFGKYSERFNTSWEGFMGLGREPGTTDGKYSMSILACNLAQEINGVSRIHGRVSQEMFENLYEGRFSNELHIGYVTNGVHYPTWTHKKWQQYHKSLLGDNFLPQQANPEMWKNIYNAEDKELWNLKDELRKELIAHVKIALEAQMRKRGEAPSLIVNTLKNLRDDVLTIGFARRFATYKRAHLLFTNIEKLKVIVNMPGRPVQFIFAGKAHPQDKAGQDLIRRIIEVSRMPEFVGKIVFVENYDMILAKKLISGCDVWLNTPTRPLEASGTSGEKAVMNGVLNLSVLDGWWAEGYTPGAGWAINEEITYSEGWRQDELDAATIYSLIEEEVAPKFYNRNEENIPIQWTAMMKENFAKISPRFTMKRQLEDYYDKYYHKLEERSQKLAQEQGASLISLVHWKGKVYDNWDSVKVLNVSYEKSNVNTFLVGEQVKIMADIDLHNLNPEDIKVELCLIKRNEGKTQLFSAYSFQFETQSYGVAHYSCNINPKYAGSWECGVRITPNHPLLPHNCDFLLVKWA